MFGCCWGIYAHCFLTVHGEVIVAYALLNPKSCSVDRNIDQSLRSWLCGGRIDTCLLPHRDLGVRKGLGPSLGFRV